MTQKTISIAVKASETIPYDQLSVLQGELKTLPQDNYERLREEIKERGFSFAVHVWRSDGKNWILDGTQRVRTVKRMVEEEGFTVGPLPVNIVEAGSLREAKHKLLSAASQYGKFTDEGLYEFVEGDFTPADLAVSFDLAGLDLPEFTRIYFPGEAVQGIEGFTDDTAKANIENTFGTSQVRMVQLFFNGDTHQEFISKSAAMSKVYGTQNITDTVLEIVREAYKLKFPN